MTTSVRRPAPPTSLALRLTSAPYRFMAPRFPSLPRSVLILTHLTCVLSCTGIGIILSSLGGFFTLLGVVFLFDRGLLAIGNVRRLRPWMTAFLTRR